MADRGGGRDADPRGVDEKRGNYYLLSDIPEHFLGAQVTQPFPWAEAWWAPLRGQTIETGYARIDLGWRALRERHEAGDRVAVICHLGSMNMLVNTIMGYPRYPPRRIGFSKTGVARLYRRSNGRWGLKYANRTRHLPPELAP